MWTIAVLMVGIGRRRWSLIFSGKAQLIDFPGDTPHGGVAYRRAVRAHANCVENLPVYGAIVLAAFVARVDTSVLDALALALLAARIGQTLTHTLFAETNSTVLIRFLFFLTQLACMCWMGAEIALRASW